MDDELMNILISKELGIPFSFVKTEVMEYKKNNSSLSADIETIKRVVEDSYYTYLYIKKVEELETDILYGRNEW